MDLNLITEFLITNWMALLSLGIASYALYQSNSSLKETKRHNLQSQEIALSGQQLEHIKIKRDDVLLLAELDPKLESLTNTSGNIITLRLAPQSKSCTILKTELIEGDVTGGNWEGKKRLEPKQEHKVVLTPKEGIGWQQAKYKLKVYFEDELTHDLYAVYTDEDRNPNPIPVNQ